MIRPASKTLRNATRTLGCALLVIPGAASAHPGHEAGGAIEGFMHPFTGIDHTLAMLLVGLVACQLGGRALWALPLTCLGALAAGGFLGSGGSGGIVVEILVGFSVIALGAAVVLNLKPPVSVAAAIVGFFALFHGFAHGVEMPAKVQAMSYGAGFIAGSSLLIAIGIALGVALNNARRAGGSPLRGRG